MSGLPKVPPGPGTLRPYHVPQAVRTTLANGLTVIAARHATTPLVTMRVVLDAGSIREPADHAGLATLAIESLDTGAAGRSGDELAWEFEQLGVELESVAGYDASTLSATVAVSRLGAALERVAEVVRAPDFPLAEVGRLRGEQLAEMLQRRKEPRALANDMILQFLYDAHHAYGRPPMGLPASVRDLTRDHTVAFHREWVTPGRSALVLVGAMAPEDVLVEVERWFGDWTGTGERAAGPPAAVSPGTTAVHIVNRPGAVQSEIRVAHVGVDRRHPDYFALRVMNSILGGAFTSRLNLSLREKHGFTYGVRSGFAFRRAPGPFVIQTAVATEVTTRAVQEIVKEIRLMHDHGATDIEVDDARDYLAGIVPLEFQTTEQVSARFADLALHDLPDDYYTRYRGGFEAVTTAEVALAARTHLKPDSLTVCIAGDASAIHDELAATGLGEVSVHDIPYDRADSPE
jgi:predicted Zn-dependent peptidase